MFYKKLSQDLSVLIMTNTENTDFNDKLMLAYGKETCNNDLSLYPLY